MTEMEWLSSDDPRAMLSYLNYSGVCWPRSKSSDRKRRLFACGCCRLIWDKIDGESRHAIEIAEKYADGLATAKELDFTTWRQSTTNSMPASVFVLHWTDARDCVSAVLSYQRRDKVGHPDLQTDLLRCLVGNPHQSIPCMKKGPHGHPANQNINHAVEGWRWLTPTVIGLAHAAYEKRRIVGCELCQGCPIRTLREPLWGSDQAICPRCKGQSDGLLDPVRLTILADALEDASCNDTNLLTHLRGSGPHAAGCWALDLILGKE